MQDAGAAAIELNIYYLPGDPQTSGRDVEQRHVDVLERVKDAVTVPVAVKLEPVLQLDRRDRAAPRRGRRRRARAVQSLPAARHRPRRARDRAPVTLSNPAEARLPRTWIALLRGRVGAALAATTGVEDAGDVASYLLAGADVVMTASALLRHGPRARDGAARRPRRRGWCARGFDRWTSCAGCSRCRRPTRAHTSAPAT